MAFLLEVDGLLNDLETASTAQPELAEPELEPEPEPQPETPGPTTTGPEPVSLPVTASEPALVLLPSGSRPVFETNSVSFIQCWFNDE